MRVDYCCCCCCCGGKAHTAVVHTIHLIMDGCSCDGWCCSVLHSKAECWCAGGVMLLLLESTFRCGSLQDIPLCRTAAVSVCFSNLLLLFKYHDACVWSVLFRFFNGMMVLLLYSIVCGIISVLPSASRMAAVSARVYSMSCRSTKPVQTFVQNKGACWTKFTALKTDYTKGPQAHFDM